MIKLYNLNKYFNRKKVNEIHVINDISLTLPDKGLVVLLGPSGSGKTTLLNVLGGLDKVQSGSIQFGDQEIKGYSSKTWDQIRNKQVGYIFQNYNLLSSLTVYDNIALTLNMVNIYDKEEIDKRIDYILDSMGMINYRKRKASQLSGGQQQRVAIARALAKNPKVIIADEPTGNLDSKNTQDIMNIIKRISQNKLVVLVTHEENIANFYADRIIRLQDGKIVSDEENRSNGSLDVRHETDIYLGDLREVDGYDHTNTKLEIFSDEDIEDDLAIKLIVKNKTIYVEVQSDEYQKMQLIESDSEINIYQGKYEHLQRDSMEQETDFNLEEIITESAAGPTDRHSVISVKDSIRLSLSRIKDSTKLGKLFYAGFAGGAILIAIAIGLLSGIYNLDPTKFLVGSEDSVIFNKSDLTYQEVQDLADHETVNYIEYSQFLELLADLPPVYQSPDNRERVMPSVVYAEYMDESKLVMGRKVEDINEFVLDQDYADTLLAREKLKYLGITTYEDLMRIGFILVLPGLGDNYEMNVRLVGIVDDDANVAYAQKELVYMSNFKVGLIEVFADDVTLVDGSAPDAAGEVYIQDNDYLLDPLESNITKVLEQEFIASGTFSSEIDIPMYLVRTEDVEKAYFSATYKLANADISFHSNDIDALITYLATQDVEAVGSYTDQIREYKTNRIANSISTVIFTVVVLGASAASYFFILRSSLLSRIYEVSVYRALGVSKGDIRKMFLTEIILITTITSMVGYLTTSFVMYRIQLLAADYWDGIHISPLSIVAGVLVIYLVNIVAGLIPVSNLLRKTPAEILSKYDF